MHINGNIQSNATYVMSGIEHKYFTQHLENKTGAILFGSLILRAHITIIYFLNTRIPIRHHIKRENVYPFINVALVC